MDEYHQILKKLKFWEDRLEKEGHNYVTDQYIKRYKDKLDKFDSYIPQKKDQTQKEPYVCSEEEWEEVMQKRIKQLKRKLDKGTATVWDRMLYDLYSGKDITKIKYFDFEVI